MQEKRLDPTPVAGLFLILTTIASLTLGPPQGLVVEVATNQPCKEQEEEFLGTKLIHVWRNGNVTINSDEVKRTELKTQLHKIFATKNLRIVVVGADSDLSFREVAEVIDAAQTEVDYVVLLTPPEETRWESGSCLTLAIRGGLTRVSLTFPRPIP